MTDLAAPLPTDRRAMPAQTPGLLTAADGTPLRAKLAQALFAARLRAFALVAPLLLFVVVSFILPIGLLLVQGVYDPTYSELMPRSTPALRAWDGASPPTEAMAEALVSDLAAAAKARTIGQVATRVNREAAGTRSLFTGTGRAAAKLTPPYLAALVADDPKWADLAVWQGMKVSAASLTGAFYAAAVDRQLTATGEILAVPDDQAIYLKLFLRTLIVAGSVMLLCLVLGYPVAWLLANLPNASANLLLILVLLPFWTSLLVRTTAWIAILQGQGVLNDLLVLVGVTDNDHRFSMIYNMTGTLVAMTHVLLPFMILPLYSVMKTIPPSYLRAAKSLGATNWTAFWRVYFPQSVPGIGAGGLLVFILAIGYYITPALVGGEEGSLISNFIAYHMQKSLNWPLAAALGGLLLAGVLALYWLYDRLVGIDNMKLG